MRVFIGGKFVMMDAPNAGRSGIVTRFFGCSGLSRVTCGLTQATGPSGGPGVIQDSAASYKKYNSSLITRKKDLLQ